MPDEHFTPQPPQFCGSTWTAVQTPPQTASNGAHTRPASAWASDPPPASELALVLLRELVLLLELCVAPASGFASGRAAAPSTPPSMFELVTDDDPLHATTDSTRPNAQALFIMGRSSPRR